MEEVVFDSVNTAAYSPRPNTPAALWTNQLSEEVKQDRLDRINVLNRKHAGERRFRMMNRTVEVHVSLLNKNFYSAVHHSEPSFTSMLAVQQIGRASCRERV